MRLFGNPVSELIISVIVSCGVGIILGHRFGWEVGVAWYTLIVYLSKIQGAK